MWFVVTFVLMLGLTTVWWSTVALIRVGTLRKADPDRHATAPTDARRTSRS